MGNTEILTDEEFKQYMQEHYPNYRKHTRQQPKVDSQVLKDLDDLCIDLGSSDTKEKE